MEYNLKMGIKASMNHVVGKDDTAERFGSGGVQVFATPMLVSIMENAALRAVDPTLPQGFATVGTFIDIKHMAATPVGMTVRAEAELIEILGKKLKFHVTAYDDKEIIGEGIHGRYIIEIEKFMKKIEDKRNNG